MMIKTLPDDLRLARTAGEFFANQSQEAISQRGYFSVVLAGGQTPANLYALLTSEGFIHRIAWDKVHFFWGDERCVPPEHVDSNYNMARQYMLDHAPIPAETLHRIQGEREPKAAAKAYEAELRAFFGQERDPNSHQSAQNGLQPRFDLVLLGMGDDGHTASLFPFSDALGATDRWVVAHFAESVRAWRITLTAQALNAAANVIFMVTGAGKAETLREVIHGERDTERLPSQLIQPVDGKLVWLLDQGAASRLETAQP